jgi:hypothetical protein
VIGIDPGWIGSGSASDCSLAKSAAIPRGARVAAARARMKNTLAGSHDLSLAPTARIGVLALLVAAAYGCSGEDGAPAPTGSGDDASLAADGSTPDATSAASDASHDASNAMDAAATADAAADADADATADAEAATDGDAAMAADADAGATSVDAGIDASTCFVPYGCAAYACDVVVDAAGDAGDGGDAGGAGDDGGTAIIGAAVATAGPRAGLGGDGGAEAGADAGGLGANEAYAFGLTDTLLGSDPNLPQGASPRTMALWVQPVSSGGTPETFFNYGTFFNDQRFGLLAVNSHDYFVGETHDLAGGVTLTDGAWHHVAATYDGATLSLYVDGTLDTSSTLAGVTLNTTGTAFAIGTTVGVSSREPFHGNISDIRVYDRVLSSSEIGSLATFAGPTANPEALRSSTSGLVFWLPLIGGSEMMRSRCAP